MAELVFNPCLPTSQSPLAALLQTDFLLLSKLFAFATLLLRQGGSSHFSLLEGSGLYHLFQEALPGRVSSMQLALWTPLSLHFPFLMEMFCLLARLQVLLLENLGSWTKRECCPQHKKNPFDLKTSDLSIKV